jgi:hypothetical protein
VSNHFTGLSLGPPLGDQRLDLCDLYAFTSPADPERTVLILNANPLADALHPDAIYRLAIDNDGDLLNDIAFSYVFSEPRDGKQTGARSDAFFFDFDGVKNLFDTSGGRNFTALHLPGESPWTGVDSNTQANVFSTAIEMPTSFLGADPDIRIWGRCSVRIDGQLLHVDRAGHPSVSSFFNTDDTKEEYNASEPVNDRARWIDMFIHLLGHTGGYTREEAIEAIDNEGTLPDMLTFNPSKPAKYPNGRVFTDDVIDYRLAFLTKGDCPPSGLSPHTDTLTQFPYLGPPH